MFQGGADKIPEYGMWRQRFGFEFRVKLASEKPGMVGELDYFDEFFIGAHARDHHSLLDKEVLIGPVELITVSMSFRYLQNAIRLVRQRAGFERARISTESHRASHVFDTRELSQLDDEFVW